MDISTGVGTQRTFQGSLVNVFASPVNMVDLLNIEFVLKRTSIDLAFGLYADRRDNRQKELSFFNYHVGDQFVVTDNDYAPTTDITTSTDRTVDADRLNVGYLRGVFFAGPRLRFATKPLGRFVASLDLGWMVQMAGPVYSDRKLSTGLTTAAFTD